MKKSIVLCAGLCAVLMFASCGSKESAYRKAYDKAKAAEAEAALNNPSQNEAPVVTPLTQQQPQQQTVDNYDNATVRTENVTLVNGSGLKEFSVVVGSFSLRANADGLQQSLINSGYNAQVVLNNAVQPPMYRVVATTFDTKVEAAASRNDLQTKYPGAWLLYAK